MEEILENERIDDLEYKGLKIIQNKDVETVVGLTKRLVETSDDKRFIEFATEFIDLLETAIANRTDVGFYF